MYHFLHKLLLSYPAVSCRYPLLIRKMIQLIIYDNICNRTHIDYIFQMTILFNINHFSAGTECSINVFSSTHADCKNIG
jgi:hypothetical protein